MPAMFPATSDWNLTPNSTELSGPLSGVAGTVLVAQMVTAVEGLEMVMLRDWFVV
jgi:hypothetical protein